VLVLLAAACSATPRAPATGESPASKVPAASAPAGVTSAPTAARPAREPVTVHVGFIPSLAYAPLYLAHEKGYYRERGVEVNLEPGAGSPTAQLGAGQLQLAGLGFDAAFFNARARGIELRVILPVSGIQPSEPSTSPLVLRKELWDNGTVRSVADLKGRKVAQNGTSTGSTQYMLSLALAKAGLTLNDVELVQGLNFADIPQALAQGGIDASALSEPFLTLSLERNIAVVLSEDHAPGVQANGIAVNGAFAHANPEAVVDFAVAYLRGARDLYGEGRNKPENLAIIEKYTKVPAATVARTRHSYADPNGGLYTDSLLAMQEFIFANTAVELPEPLKLEEIVDPTYARRAVEILGEFRENSPPGS
jgi:NitT/TauT family transport system substrate-binding protein